MAGGQGKQASRESYLSRALDVLGVEEKEREEECTGACDGGRRVQYK
jgi:hypothetical protein